MGKRELLLVAVFAVMGFVVYQVTSPPGDPNRPGWSFKGLIDQARREVRGNQARAELTKTNTIPAPDTLREIRIVKFPTSVAIVGEDRADIEAVLKITSRAYDDAEAKQTAEATKLLIDPAGELLTLTMDYPDPGQQTAALSLKVPKRFKLRVDDKGGTLVVSDVAAITLGPSRGETIITNIAGAVQIGSQRGSVLNITNVGSLKLSTVNAETRINGVKGPATLNFQGGDVRAEGLQGTIELESRNAEMKFEKLDKATAPLRFSNTGGQLTLSGLAAETRIDGRRTEVRVEQASPAPLAIYNEGENTEVTLAAGGFDIDALAVIGRITLDDALQKAGVSVATTKTGDNSNGGGGREEQRINGKIKGGGSKITLRSTRGDLTLRSR
jgi:hypothetical protein